MNVILELTEPPAVAVMCMHQDCRRFQCTGVRLMTRVLHTCFDLFSGSQAPGRDPRMHSVDTPGFCMDHPFIQAHIIWTHMIHLWHILMSADVVVCSYKHTDEGDRVTLL